jgi:hypothetical protein
VDSAGHGGDLILGTAIGLRLEDVQPFLKSLFSTGYAGDTVLFVDRELERQIRRVGVHHQLELVPARNSVPFRFRVWTRSNPVQRAWAALQVAVGLSLRAIQTIPLPDTWTQRLELQIMQIFYSPMDARFLRYERLLSGRAYGRVLLTDVRDVLFQSDPFAQLPAEGLAVSLETSSYTLATEEHNASWLKRVYGSRVLERIGHRRVSCVGVTYGDRARMLDYLQRFNGELRRLSPRALGLGGADTAIHNVLLWTGQLGEPTLLETVESPVATLNAVEPEAIQLDPEGYLIVSDGSKVSVVHQYDRQPEACGALAARFAS